MSARPDPEALALEALTDDERRALLERVDTGDAEAVQRLADLLASLDGDDWRAAVPPTLRFSPEGAGRTVPFWSRVCVRGDAGEHRVAAPYVALAAVAAVLLAFGAGFVVRGGDAGGADEVADARLEAAPGVSLRRSGAAPADAAGVARMIGGRDGRVLLRAHGLRPTGEHRWYALWMVRDDGEMVSAGTFRVRADGTVRARFRAPVDPARHPAVDVSIQTAADGEAHSGRSVLRSSPST